MGVIKGDTRGLDYSSNSQLPLLMQPPPPHDGHSQHDVIALQELLGEGGSGF